MSRYCSGFNDLAGEKVDGLSPAGRRTVEQVRVTSPVRLFLAYCGKAVPVDPLKVVDLAVSRAAPGVTAMAGAVLHAAASLYASLCPLTAKGPAPLRRDGPLPAFPAALLGAAGALRGRPQEETKAGPAAA